MIRLNTVTRKLQAVLAGAVTTNQLPITVCYTDATTTSWLGGTTVINTNSTTPVDICAAPAASTVRDIDYISVRNSDTVPATVTIRYNDNATLYTLFTATLAVGDILIYVHGSGVHVLDSSGAVKSTVTFAGISVASGKNVTMLKSMTLTAADDTGSYTFPTGTKTLLAADGTGASLTAVNAVTLLTKTWAAPDAIGSGTPAAGTFTTLVAGTSVSTPSIVTATGAITVTPASGSGLNINLSTTGDFALNTNQFYVDTSAAFIGIGTNIPGYLLHLYKNAGSDRYTLGAVQNADSTGSGEFSFLNDSGLVGSIGSYGTGTATGIGFPNQVVLRSDSSAGLVVMTANASTSAFIRFFTGGTSSANERARISSSGVVCIGTTTPTTGSKLTVAGIVDITDATDATSTTAASDKTAGGFAAVKQIIAGTAVLGNFLTAIPAGGAATCGFKSTSTANFGVFFGSGAPTLSTAKGSLYLRSDGSTTNNRAYINTDGGTTWTALTTAA